MQSFTLVQSVDIMPRAFDEDRDHYICKVTRTVQDAVELVKLGFDYVTDVNSVKLFRKPT